MRLELLDEAMKEFLLTETNKEWELSKPPRRSATLNSYGIIYRVNGSEGIGTWSSVENRREIYYQFTIVGFQHREVAWLSDLVNDSLVGSKPGGGFKRPLNVQDISIEDRRVRSIGSIHTSGEDRFASNDDYLITIGEL